MGLDLKIPALTLAQLARQLVEKFERDGRRADTLQARLHHVLPVLGSVAANELGEKHYKKYVAARQNQLDGQGKSPPQHRLDREIETIKRVVRYQWETGGELERGYSIAETMKATGLSYSLLRGWEKTGFLPRSIAPVAGSNHPFRTARYSFTDLEALRRARSLREQGCSKQALIKVVQALRQRHDFQCNAEALSRTQLIYDGADVWEITGKAERISCLLTPDLKPVQDVESVRSFAESCFIPEELSPPKVSHASHKTYRRQFSKHLLSFFGKSPLNAVSPRAVREFVDLKMREGHAADTVEDWIGLLDRMYRHASLRKRFKGERPTLSIRPVGTRGPTDYAVHSPETIAQISSTLTEPINIWYLMRVLLGLPPRELCALKWCHLNCTDKPLPTIEPFSIAIRLKVVNGVVRPASDRELRNQPLPERLAALFLTWRQQTNFGGNDDFVFADSLGRKPIDPHNVYTRHLKPAATRLGIDHKSLYRLERTATILAGQAGLTLTQQDAVLRLHRGPEIRQPTTADVAAVRRSLNRTAGLILGGGEVENCELVSEAVSNICLSLSGEVANTLPMSRAAHRNAGNRDTANQTGIRAGGEQRANSLQETAEPSITPEQRESEFQSYRQKHKLSINDVATLAKVDRSDLFRWRKGILSPPSSEKARRIDLLILKDIDVP